MAERSVIRIARISVVLMVMVLFMGYYAAKTSGAETDPGMTIGCSALAKNVNTADAQKLWYAGDAWYVIAYDGDGCYPPAWDNLVTLLHKEAEGSVAFHAYTHQDTDNAYGMSMVRTEIESWYSGDHARFSEAEQNTVFGRELMGGSSDVPYAGYYPDGIKGDTMENVRIWPLSVTEAYALCPDLLRTGSEYWLRTPGMPGFAAVYDPGIKDVEYHGEISRAHLPVRPAFHLQMETVNLISAAAGGKVSGKIGPDALTEVGTNTSGEWKATIWDSPYGLFNIHDVYIDKDGATFRYEDAVSGKNCFISAVIADDSGNVKYYGRIKAITDYTEEDGSLSVNLPAGMSQSDKLYVFSEQVNEDRKTDISSNLRLVRKTHTMDERAANTLKAKGKKVKVSYTRLRKKALTIKRRNAIKVSRAKGSVTYKLINVKATKYRKYFKVDPDSGDITLKKGLKKGKYTVRIRVTAAGNNKHKTDSKTVKLIINVR